MVIERTVSQSRWKCEEDRILTRSVSLSTYWRILRTNRTPH